MTTKDNLVILTHKELPSGENIAFQQIGPDKDTDAFDAYLVTLDEKQQITDVRGGILLDNNEFISDFANITAAKQKISEFKSGLQAGKLGIVADADSAIALLPYIQTSESKANIRNAFNVEDPEKAVAALRNALTR